MLITEEEPLCTGVTNRRSVPVINGSDCIPKCLRELRTQQRTHRHIDNRRHAISENLHQLNSVLPRKVTRLPSG